jgi:predicted nucleotidyltransferase
MKTAGVICEYNPFHLGHAEHIERTRKALGADAGVICIMSGNFVQRGDFAVFNKHARAKMALFGGADVVIELPVPYAVSSAGGFAKAGVYILDMLGVCDYLSFGSESGNIDLLCEAARAISTVEAQFLIRQWLDSGLSYASAQQKAADALLGTNAVLFGSPNNTLGIEYIKAIKESGSKMQPITVKRVSGEHDGDTGNSATALRKILLGGKIPSEFMLGAAAAVCVEEIASGRGPVSTSHAEQAVLARLRVIDDFSEIPGASEGLEHRFKRYALTEPSIPEILSKVKTKRYVMSRLRRMLICAAIGIKTEHTQSPPPYIRVLAMNEKGMELLKKARTKARLPIITKPASVRKLCLSAQRMFNLEAAATDLYVLAYGKREERFGGSEWRISPTVNSCSSASRG